ncbi:hypothetical protein PMAYCL1PPCAC_16805, partial [Pristionchus mayeri]
MGITAAGSYQYKHYHRLSDKCQLMSCNRAGVNVDYFTLLLRTAGLTAIPYPRDISNDAEVLEMLGNGTVDVGWFLKRQELPWNEKAIFTLPVTAVTYGYIVTEDRTKMRD